MRKIIPLLAFLALSPLPAAAAADAAGAEALKQQVNSALLWRFDMAKELGSGFTLGGPIAVAPKDAAYEIQLPKAAYLLRSGNRIDIGTVTLSATPAAGAGAWDVETTLPSTLTVYDSANAPVATISLGQQHLGATCWPEKDMCTTSSASLDDIQIKSTAGTPVTTRIKFITLTANLGENNDNTWSGPVGLNMQGILVDVDGEAPVQFGLGSFASRTAYERLDLRPVARTREEAQALFKQGLPQDAAARKAALLKLLIKPPLMADRIETAVTFNKILLHAKGAAHPQDISVEHASFSGSLAPDADGTSQLTSKAGYKDLRATFFPPLYAGLIPETADVDVVFNRVPMNDLTTELLASLRKAAEPAPGKDPAAVQAEARAGLQRLPQLLQRAGTTMNIQSISLNGRDVTLNAGGAVQAAANAGLGATGKVTVSLRGLDEFLQKMKADVMKPGSDISMLATAGALATLQFKGKESKAADGKSLRNYIFELMQDGRLLLNGEEFRPLPPPAPAAAAPAPAKSKKP